MLLCHQLTSQRVADARRDVGARIAHPLRRQLEQVRATPISAPSTDIYSGFENFPNGLYALWALALLVTVSVGRAGFKALSMSRRSQVRARATSRVCMLRHGAPCYHDRRQLTAAGLPAARSGRVGRSATPSRGPAASSRRAGDAIGLNIDTPVQSVHCASCHENGAEPRTVRRGGLYGSAGVASDTLARLASTTDVPSEGAVEACRVGIGGRWLKRESRDRAAASLSAAGASGATVLRVEMAESAEALRVCDTTGRGVTRDECIETAESADRLRM